MAERSRGLAGAARSAVRGAVKAVRGRSGSATSTAKAGAASSSGKAAAAKKATPTKATATKAAPATKAAAKKATAKKAAAKKAAPATKAAAQKAAPTKKTVAKKTAAKKTVAKKAAAKKTVAKKTAAKKATAGRATAKQSPAKKSPAKATPVKQAAAPSALAVREDEAPWTEAELAAVRAELLSEVDRLRRELQAADLQIAELIANAGDGGGDDQVDTGAKAFEREHEMTLANNVRDALAQNEHALKRIADGTYGTCENCGNPIGKRRLQAFPRATLCLTCKQRQERH